MGATARKEMLLHDERDIAEWEEPNVEFEFYR